MLSNLWEKLSNINTKLAINVYLAVMIIFCLAVSYFHPYAIPLCLIIAIATCELVRSYSSSKEIDFNAKVDNIIRNIERTNYYAVRQLDVGMAVFGQDGKLQWHNELLPKLIGKKKLMNLLPDEVFPSLGKGAFDHLTLKDGERVLHIEDVDRYFRLRYTAVRTQESRLKMSGDKSTISGLILFLTDITEQEQARQEYINNKLCLMSINFDNYDEVVRGLSESSIAQLTADINGLITNWVTEQKGFICRINREKCFVGLKVSVLKEIQASRFEILDKIREVRSGNQVPPTLSIGVSCDGDTFSDLQKNANEALNVALGRGGDQAVVVMDGVTQYYGGTSEVTTKGTRVRARMVAQSIKEKMQKADRIFIMGHKNEDFDAIGSAIGMAKLAISLEKPTHLVFGKEAYENGKLKNESIEKIEEIFKDKKLSEMEGDLYLQRFVTEEEALLLVTENSLLILVDHHRAALTSSAKVLEAIKNRIIVDHHRRSEDIINQKELLYLEPSASSASELVTELVGYFNDRLVLYPAEATALYSGIVLDTKNFAVQTGERTFEAAALLRRSGVNTNLVRLLFKDDIDMVQRRSRLIAAAKHPLPNLAITVYKQAERNSTTQITAAQAADNLVMIDGISIGITIVEYKDGGLSISARSDGSANVQIIMEALGGGGHQTVAGAQLSNKKASDIEPELIALAKKQFEQLEESNEQ